MIHIYTDGGCRGNPGVGAWAFVIETEAGRRHQSGFASHTTNNIMELTAAIQALETVRDAGERGAIHIHIDSQYVLKGITEWMAGWKKKGWRTASGDPVKNRELWEKLDALHTQLRPQWVWVRGHNGHPGNEECDRLVNEAMDQASL